MTPDSPEHGCLGEVFVGGEGLARGAVDVLTMHPVPLRTEAGSIPGPLRMESVARAGVSACHAAITPSCSSPGVISSGCSRSI